MKLTNVIIEDVEDIEDKRVNEKALEKLELCLFFFDCYWVVESGE